MRVMTCSRIGCENIMCEVYVQYIGYICTDCQQEFKSWLRATRVHPENSAEIKTALKMFLETDKGEIDFYDNEKFINDFFRNHTF